MGSAALNREGHQGDGSLVEQEKSFLTEVRARALALKRQSESAERAVQQITAEFKGKYPAWSVDDLTSFVKGAYAE